jgi:hypothetical protein
MIGVGCTVASTPVIGGDEIAKLTGLLNPAKEVTVMIDQLELPS